MSDILPEGAFFATQYYDGQRQMLTRDIYYSDGRVETTDGQTQSLVTRLTPAQVQQLKEHIQHGGLLQAHDLERAGTHDTADYTYVWRLGAQAGQVTNHAYPARTTPVFSALEELLAGFESEQGSTPSE